MDTTDPEIVFDENGICNHCKSAVSMLEKLEEEKKTFDLVSYIRNIKKEGKDKEYDCVVGISGGVDSSFVMIKVHEMGLRPYAIHIDNGWDTEVSVKNVQKTLDKLGIELHNFNAGGEEFRKLQLAFLKASTPDIEIPSDHALYPILAMHAHKIGCRYIIMGQNTSSESILPRQWSHGHSDWKYIRNIYKKFGEGRLKNYPYFTRADLDYFHRKFVWFNLLDHLDYDKEKTKAYLISEYGWDDYGGKHHESFYTKFYQTYILPVKFGYDKRRAHFSSLIASGQMTREEALRELEKKPYDETTLEDDIRYFCEHMKITRQEFDDIMALPVKTYWDYPNMETDFMGRLTASISALFR